MKQLDRRTVRAFVWGLGLGAIGGLLLASKNGRRIRDQLAERFGDLYYELEPRLVAIGIEDIVLAGRVQSALRSAGLEHGVSLSVRGRKIQLRGTVCGDETIQCIEAVVWAVPGVRKVFNHLEELQHADDPRGHTHGPAPGHKPGAGAESGGLGIVREIHVADSHSAYLKHGRSRPIGAQAYGPIGAGVVSSRVVYYLERVSQRLPYGRAC